LLRLIPELIGNFFVSLLSRYILTKQFSEADMKLISPLYLKCFFFSNRVVFTTLNLRNNLLIEFLSKNFLFFPEYITDSTTIWSFRKIIIGNYKEG